MGVDDRIGFGPDITAILTASVPPRDAAPPSSVSVSGVQTSSETFCVTRAVSTLDARVVVIGVVGRLDGYSHGELKDVIARVIDEGHRFLVVDLSRCSFCDPAGLAVLVNAQVTLAGKKGGLRLAGLSAQLKDAMLLLRLDSVLSLADDARAAAVELSALLQSK